MVEGLTQATECTTRQNLANLGARTPQTTCRQVLTDGTCMKPVPIRSQQCVIRGHRRERISWCLDGTHKLATP
eukprot:5183677-Amphidinium_carterae.1